MGRFFFSTIHIYIECRYGTVTSADLIESVGNGGVGVMDTCLKIRTWRNLHKSDPIWDTFFDDDNARRALLTEDQKTQEAYEMFLKAGEKPEIDYDDDEYDSADDYSDETEDKEGAGGTHFFSSSEEDTDDDEEKLVSKVKDEKYVIPDKSY